MNDEKSNPPRLVAAFLQWFCPDYLLEEITGDLVQKFERDVRIFGIRKARLRFAWNTFGSSGLESY